MAIFSYEMKVEMLSLISVATNIRLVLQLSCDNHQAKYRAAISCYHSMEQLKSPKTLSNGRPTRHCLRLKGKFFQAL